MSEETIPEADAIEAWHFLPADRRLRYGDNTLVEPGQILTVNPPLKLCSRGLHASVRAIDALEYAPGPIACRVKVWGEVRHDTDKLCAEHRQVAWMVDATTALHRFACDLATEALDASEARGETIDPRSRNAIAVKLAWIEGKATDEELAAASDAAWAAASDAARAAASHRLHNLLVQLRPSEPGGKR